MGSAAVLMVAGCGMAATDRIEAGEAVYEKLCASCHPGNGPDLEGVVDRRIGSLPGYDYSDALRNSSERWTAERLRVYLTGPQKMFPNGRMMIKPLSAARASTVVSYLEAM